VCGRLFILRRNFDQVGERLEFCFVNKLNKPISIILKKEREEFEHLMNPVENKENGRLDLVCRNCNYSEPAHVPQNYCIFTRQVTILEEEKQIPWKDLGSDMTLYRSSTDECPKCECLESVFILVQYTEKVEGYLVCSKCGHRTSAK